MAGYFDYSMSNNAASAYDCGEMPLSKWTKTEILNCCGDKSEILKKLTLAELKANLLRKSPWHHTSCRYNCTDFYSFDEDALEEFNVEKVNEIISNRKPKEKIEKNNEIVVKAAVTFTILTGKYQKYRKTKRITEIVEMKKSDKIVKTSYGYKSVDCLNRIKFLEN